MQISCDICTRFARYLYSTKQRWILNLCILDTFRNSNSIWAIVRIKNYKKQKSAGLGDGWVARVDMGGYYMVDITWVDRHSNNK